MAWRSRLPSVSRWWLVVLAATALGLAGTYQFLWSTLREPLSVRLATSEPSLGTVFTVYVVAQTLSQFPAGWVRDRYGPRLPMFVGAILLGLGFAGTAMLESVPGVVASWAVGGVGVGIAYTVAVNTPVKWFTDRRGLATGLVTMSFGGASFLLIPVVRSRIDADFQTTVLALGVLTAVGCLLAAVILRDPTLRESEGEEAEPDAGHEPRDGQELSEGDDPDERHVGNRNAAVESPTSGHAGKREESVESLQGTDAGVERDGSRAAPEATSPEGVPSQRQGGVTWRGAIGTWQFWLLYGIFIANNLVGLMIIGKTITFATKIGLSAGAATLGASLIAIGEAGGVLAGGVASDRLGYRSVAGGGMVLAGLSLAGGVLAGDAGFGLGFALLVAGGAFFRAPVFAVFPALVGEYYGPKYSSQNYALLYSAKLWGGLGAGVVASAVVGLAGWSTLFLVGAGLFVLAGIATMFVRPIRRPGAGADTVDGAQLGERNRGQED